MVRPPPVVSQAATGELAPVLARAVSVPPTTWLAHAYVLEAIARDALGDPAAAGGALRQALQIAEVDGAVAAFLFHPPARELFDRYAPDRSQHFALAAEIRPLLPAGTRGPASPPKRTGVRGDAPSRVDRSAEPNRHLFLKLGAHRRTEAVLRARALGLLAPSPDRAKDT